MSSNKITKFNLICNFYQILEFRFLLEKKSNFKTKKQEAVGERLWISHNLTAQEIFGSRKGANRSEKRSQ